MALLYFLLGSMWSPIEKERHTGQMEQELVGYCHTPMASFFSLAWMAAARLEVESRLGLVVILAFSRALSNVAATLKYKGIQKERLQCECQSALVLTG